MTSSDRPWEPDPASLGKNWTAMFEPPARGASADVPISAPTAEPCDDAALCVQDTGEYKPWVLQRGSGQRVLMIDFRRYEPRLGRWNGFSIAYPQLVGIEYTGDALLGLDFGKAQIVIEGCGLDELARHLQQGTVVSVQEFAERLWPRHAAGALVTAIRKVEVSL